MITNQTANVKSPGVATAGGFTLLELMIAVVVVAILTTLAYPAYQDQIRKSRRADAHGALVELANLQQQFFSDNLPVGFAKSLSAADGLNGGNGYPTKTIGGGYYTLKIEDATADCPIATCFVASATPPDGGPQMADKKCRVMTIRNTGARTSTDAEGANSTADCWRS